MKKLLRSIALSSLTVAGLLGQQASAQTTKATEAEAKMFAVSAGYERFMSRWSPPARTNLYCFCRRQEW